MFKTVLMPFRGVAAVGENWKTGIAHIEVRATAVLEGGRQDPPARRRRRKPIWRPSTMRR
ncbi:hypothetical protein [Bradyrhizobium lablabi]|uniref:hypothetical protein n=1 Tax=Bradyrhizobium lablabi TaxID=722472 RepID=UPI001BA9BA54|nr:hypothetical protein [Bradyrhizobium lablabi]